MTVKRLSKLKVKLPNGKTRIVWAIKSKTPTMGIYSCSVLDKYGDPKNEVLLITQGDIVWEKPAQMNSKYAELEIIH